MRILISGASVAGPVLAYWLTRHGFAVTVVERAPTLRKSCGHAVDLFRPAMDISEKMGVLPRVEERATGTSRMSVYREGARRPVRVDLGVRGLAYGARLISALPAGPGRALLRLTTRSGRVYNSMTVDDYPPPNQLPD